MTSGLARPDGRNALDRLLSAVTEVRPGEAKLALVMALYVFLLLCAYYVIKPVREALILASGGAELKSYASVGQALLLMILVPLYSWFAGKMKRARLIPLVTGFFLVVLILFFVLARLAVPHLGVAFFLFVGVFNLMIVAQFWALANDIYSQEQGERLFPVVAFGASVGAVAGSQITRLLILPLGLEQMLLVSAGLLGCTVVLVRWVERQAEKTQSSAEESPTEHEAIAFPPSSRPHSKSSRHGAFALVLKSPYLLLVAGLMFLTNLVNSNGEYMLGVLVVDDAKLRVASGASAGADLSATIGLFYSNFFTWVNVAGVILQLFVVSRVIRWIGIRGALLVLPMIALGSYAAIAFVPALSLVRWLKTAENSTDYSLNNTVRNALFLPLTHEEKFKAKQATDTFFVRGGDAASTAVVAVGSSLGWLTSSYAWFNIAAVAVWLLLAAQIGVRYARLRTPSAP